MFAVQSGCNQILYWKIIQEIPKKAKLQITVNMKFGNTKLECRRFRQFVFKLLVLCEKIKWLRVKKEMCEKERRRGKGINR